MGLEQRALAALAEDVGQALIRYAGLLRAANPGDQAETGVTSSPSLSAPPVVVPSMTPSAPQASRSSCAEPATLEVADPRLRRLGISQKKALVAVLAAGQVGLTANQVAEETGLTSTNTPRMLKALAERGLIVSRGSNPIVWFAIHQ